ncbi:MAG: ABC transporter permease [Rhodospirillaceae bacterium]|jgi:putative hydroxymethylpyrimidine transport system permease protein|nr:ABC transporter permease [Rhodospirillaceae bacterium]MBT4590227.1 ABC transporter permease [Rhodospirillaceae bacterium]MBT4941136.1 ABC transporter permease [Rhodospirillaceae bacterium]MBT5939711.1 ABC transporter permease [Rhodospirillaceae bacterium]MBT7268741.1 ABC transporter permease [Rhodospirillaceae bacterium]
MSIARPLIIFLGLLLIWHLIVIASGVPPYILPAPHLVFQALAERGDILFSHAWITLLEIVFGLALGTLLGSLSALTLSYYQPARRWLMPILVVSQAIPVFALAPILVLWLGYGMVSKVAMATLIIYFPVTAAFFDGLRRTEPGHLDLAKTMNATRWSVLRHIRIPAALPAFASGLRVATAVAPIGAIVGEWVGSSEGLGFLMLHANGRMQIDVMFAALFILAVIAVALYYAVDAGLKRLLFWSSETTTTEL